MTEPAAELAGQTLASNTAGEEAETQGISAVHLYDTCPPEKTVLRILLVSGQKTDFICNVSDTVDLFLKKCFDQWPHEWKKDKSIVSPLEESNLKLLHRGKFAERTSTLESNGFNLGLITVVHILVKNDSSQGGRDDPKGEHSNQAACRCTIL